MVVNHLFDEDDEYMRERHAAVLNWFIKYCEVVVVSDDDDMKTHTVNSWIDCHGGWVSS